MIQIKVVDEKTKNGVVVEGKHYKNPSDFISVGDKVFILEKDMIVPLHVANLWLLHRDYGERREDGTMLIKRNCVVKIDRAFSTPPYKPGTRENMSLDPNVDDFMPILGITYNSKEEESVVTEKDESV